MFYIQVVKSVPVLQNCRTYKIVGLSVVKDPKIVVRRTSFAGRFIKNYIPPLHDGSHQVP